jgi:hypothetical protein
MEDDLGAQYPAGVDGICACDDSPSGVDSEEDGWSEWSESFESCGWGFQAVRHVGHFELELERGVERGTRWCGPPGQASCPRSGPS